MCASRDSGISMHVTILPYHMIPHHTIPNHTKPHHTKPYHTIPNHTIPNHTIPYDMIPSSIPNACLCYQHTSYNTKCTILPLKPSYPTNACFPPDSGIGMHISALPLIRVTSGYPGDIREGGMHYLPPAGQSTCHS